MFPMISACLMVKSVKSRFFQCVFSRKTTLNFPNLSWWKAHKISICSIYVPYMFHICSIYFSMIPPVISPHFSMVNRSKWRCWPCCSALRHPVCWSRFPGETKKITRISMDFYGFLWISMDFYGFLWISMDFYVVCGCDLCYHLVMTNIAMV